MFVKAPTSFRCMTYSLFVISLVGGVYMLFLHGWLARALQKNILVEHVVNNVYREGVVPADSVYNVTSLNRTQVKDNETETFHAHVGIQLPKSKRTSLEVFILSAIVANTTEYDGYLADIKLNAWTALKHRRVRIKCCYIWSSGNVTEFYEPARIGRSRSRVSASQYSCPLSMSVWGIRGVKLEFAKSSCLTDDKTYIKPVIPKPVEKEETFAICLKLVYGNVDNSLFLDWIEFYKELKVDKIFLFTYNITKETDAVIRRYVATGFLERLPFMYPLDAWKRGNVGQKTVSYWDDERVIVYDCLQRHLGYTYLAIIDMDEFLVPRKHDNLKDMMKYLMKTHPNSGGFVLKSYIFVKNLTGPGDVKGSDIVNYFQRTPPMSGVKARPKNIILPTRTIVKGYDTHVFEPSMNFTRVYVDSSIAAINHYRVCYSNLRQLCSSNLVTDKYILKFVKWFRH